jgi:hypothetical protein
MDIIVKSYLGGLSEFLQKLYDKLPDFEKEVIQSDVKHNNSSDYYGDDMQNHLQDNMLLNKEIALSLHSKDSINIKCFKSVDRASLIMIDKLQSLKDCQGYCLHIVYKTIESNDEIYLDCEFEHDCDLRERFHDK